jgi:hypothetical protein
MYIKGGEKDVIPSKARPGNRNEKWWIGEIRWGRQ